MTLVDMSGVTLGFVFVYEDNNFNQIYLFFFLWKSSTLLFRMKFVEGESERTNHVYCHIEKGNLIIFCKMYFWLAYIYMWSADLADEYNF